MSKDVFIQHNDGYDVLRRQFLNKEVNLFPSDTMWKYGKIVDINPTGIVVEITSVQNDFMDYKVGDIYFLPHEKAVYKLCK